MIKRLERRRNRRANAREELAASEADIEIEVVLKPQIPEGSRYDNSCFDEGDFFDWMEGIH